MQKILDSGEGRTRGKRENMGMRHEADSSTVGFDAALMITSNITAQRTDQKPEIIRLDEKGKTH